MKSKITIFLLLCLTIQLFYGCKEIKSKKIKNNVEANILKIKKSKVSETEILELLPTVMEAHDNEEPHFCVCQGTSFRVVQIFSQLFPDNILLTYDVEVETGWSTHCVEEFFKMKLGVNNFLVNSNSPDPKDLQLKDCYYKFKIISTGEEVEFRATNKIFIDNFLKIRSQFKNGDNSMEEQFETEKSKIADIIKTIPFKNMFVINKFNKK